MLKLLSFKKNQVRNRFIPWFHHDMTQIQLLILLYCLLLGVVTNLKGMFPNTNIILVILIKEYHYFYVLCIEIRSDISGLYK